LGQSRQGQLAPPFHLNHPSLALEYDRIDFLKPFFTVLFMVYSLLAIFFLPFSDVLLKIDLKKRLFRRLILSQLANLKLKISLQDPHLFLQPRTLRTTHNFLYNDKLISSINPFQ
jgi:hypothetical protein